MRSGKQRLALQQLDSSSTRSRSGLACPLASCSALLARGITDSWARSLVKLVSKELVPLRYPHLSSTKLQDGFLDPQV